MLVLALIALVEESGYRQAAPRNFKLRKPIASHVMRKDFSLRAGVLGKYPHLSARSINKFIGRIRE
jgi:hypothetical protein